jgi:SNF2 family DNA or RNA helicase
MLQGEIKRVLIVCPVSIMDTAWRADLFRTLMHRTVAIATGSKAKRQQLINGDYEFVIINFDGVKVVREELAAGGFDLVIVDEATAVKTTTTDRWKALYSLIKPTTRLWLMTGTPASQSPTDAYGLAKLVNPSAVPKFFGAFRDLVMYKITNFKWAPKTTAQDTVFKVLQPAIRFTKAECLDLPDLLYTTRDIPLTVQQMKYYEEVRKSMVAVAAGAEITAVNAAGLLNKLLQISQGVAYTTDREVIEFDVSNRVNELLDVIEQTTHKVIVFVPFRHALEMLEQALAKAGIATESIHGGVSAGQRAESIKRFQTEERPKALLLIPQAAAHGITLTKADTVVWWGPVPSAELYLQGNARAHRAGQVNKVTVVRLQGSPVERRVYAMLDGKVDLHQGLVDLYRQEIA